MLSEPSIPNGLARPHPGEAGSGTTQPTGTAQPAAPDRHDHAPRTIAGRPRRLFAALARLRLPAPWDLGRAPREALSGVFGSLKPLRWPARLGDAGWQGPTEHDSRLVAILFIDVVSSAGLLARLGDDDGQRILEGFLGPLAEMAGRHGGRVVKWLGDGLMVSFSSVAGALRCAIAMQLASRQPIEEERLAIRVGVNAGETLCSDTDFFGAAVVTAHRLCRAANAGQTLSSEVVVGLVAGRPEFGFSAADRTDRDGPCPVTAYDLHHQPTGPASSARTPCVALAGPRRRLR